MAVVVLGEFPQEDAAQVALAQGVGDFGRGRGRVVVADETVRLRVGVEQIRGRREVVEIFGPLSRGKKLFDLCVGDGGGSGISAESIVRAECPEIIDIEGVTVESGAEIDLLGGYGEERER